ncbi:MAG: outer membrane beta-barrel protein [Alphaproteobacteria bacterium]|nr:outer membrane beta-barrel protein [Alphaproteobacteria bacterium]
MKKTLIAAAAVLAATATAQADDKVFDGGYVGGELGYTDAGDGVNGAYFGAFGGYRKQNDSGLVYGIEGTFGKTSADLTAGGIKFDDVYDREWTVMGTLGTVVGESKRTLLYVGAGFVQQKASISYGGYSESATGESYVVSAGFERALGENMSLRLRASTYEFEIASVALGLGFRF